MRVEIFALLAVVGAASAYTVKELKCECLIVEAEKYIYPNYTCTTKKAKPTESSSVSFDFVFKKPINKVWIEATVESKVYGKFQPFGDFKKVELCKEISNVATSANPFFVMGYKTAQEAMPKVVHECPYESMRAKDVIFGQTHIPMFLQRGEFRIRTKIATSSKSDSLCTITLVISMDS